MAIDELGAQPQSQGVSGPLHGFQCVGCSHGARSAAAPERCPICGGTVWEYEAWHPFVDYPRPYRPTDVRRS